MEVLQNFAKDKSYHILVVSKTPKDTDGMIVEDDKAETMLAEAS